MQQERLRHQTLMSIDRDILAAVVLKDNQGVCGEEDQDSTSEGKTIALCL